MADLFEHRVGGRGMPPQLDRRMLLRAAHRVRVAAVAQVISSLADGVQVVQPLGQGDCMKNLVGSVL
nr:hypothetical protein [Sphaerotilus natans]